MENVIREYVIREHVIRVSIYENKQQMEHVSIYFINNKIFAIMNIIICCKSRHFLLRAHIQRQQLFITHRLKRVTIFKKLRYNSAFFYFKTAKSRSAAFNSAPSRPPDFLYYSHKTQIQKYSYPPLFRAACL